MRSPMRVLSGLIRWIILSVLLWAAALAVLVIMLVQPIFRTHPETRKTIASERLREHVYALAIDHAPRNFRELWSLNASAHYIADQFEKAGGRVSEQTFSPAGQGPGVEQSKGNTYRNVIASFGPETGPRIVVGAHYDTYNEVPGADANASGISGLIELAYLLGRIDLGRRIDLVAFTLKEPPFFETTDMGSARHATSLQEAGAEVKAMICIDMIGCFSDEVGSQRYPYSILKLLYPDCGNYIGILGGYADRGLIRQMKASMRGATDLPVHAICAPRNVAGMALSDHRSYWANGFTAVLVTDTSLYRNIHYHTMNDTPDTLDYERMSKVVLGVYEAVVHLANESD